MAEAEPEDDDFDVTVVEEPGENVTTAEEPPEPAEPKEGENYTVDDLSGESGEKIEKRRLSSKEKRERQREQRNRLEAKVKALTAQTVEMQRKLQSTENNQYGLRLDGIKWKKEELQNVYNNTLRQLEEFEAKGNLRGTREAVELKIKLENEYRALEEREQQIAQVASRPSPIDNTTANYFKGWIDRNKAWYKADLSNRDSRIANELSQDILGEGFVTSQPEFWEELDRRCADYIPTKRLAKKPAKNEPEYDDDDEPPPQTVSGRGSGARSEGSRQEVKIPSWTVQQWKNAGIWDDPKARNKAIKEYQAVMEKEKRNG